MVTRTKPGRVSTTAVKPEPIFNDDNLIIDPTPIYARTNQRKSAKSKLALFAIPAALVLTAGVVLATSQPRPQAAVQPQDKPVAVNPAAAPPMATDRAVEVAPPPAAASPTSAAPARRSAAVARRAPEQAASAPDVTNAAQDASAIVAPPAATSMPATPPTESPVTAPTAIPDQIAPSSAAPPMPPIGIAPTDPGVTAPAVQ